MNAKQNQILSLYQQSHPNQTLREMSQDFGINISRVFRLLNGHEMKISEYEKIESVLSEREIKNPDLFYLTKRCQENLSPKKINHLISEMEMALHCNYVAKPMESSLPEGA